MFCFERVKRGTAILRDSTFSDLATVSRAVPIKETIYLDTKLRTSDAVTLVE